jgi:hypothetical protein
MNNSLRVGELHPDDDAHKYYRRPCIVRARQRDVPEGQEGQACTPRRAPRWSTVSARANRRHSDTLWHFVMLKRSLVSKSVLGDGMTDLPSTLFVP